MLLFVQHRGEVLDKGTLMKAIWPDVIVEENNLNQSISAVRRILGDSRDQHRYIITIPGVGYQFVSDVKVMADEATPGIAESSGVGFAGSGAEPGRMVEPATAAPTPVVPPVLATGTLPDTRGRRQRLSTSIASPAVRWARVAAVLLLAGALLWMLGHRAERQIASQSTSTPAPESATDSTAPRLAVLPFTNLSPEPANAFFADGLHEEIVSTLAERIPGIAVISRTTMMSYRQTPKPLGEVARELGATHVVEGTVRREGNQVRLTLQLVDAGTDRYLWSKTYDRALASAMTLQSEVAAEVAEQMSVRLVQGAEHAPSMTRDPRAYDLYLQALLMFRELGLSGDLTTKSPVVEDLLNRALAGDPRFALAYAQRARLHTLSFISGLDLSDTNHRSILTDLDAAQHIAPHDPIVLAARAYFLLADGEIDRGLEVMQAAEAAGLKDADWLIPKTRMLLSRRRVDEAVRVHEHMLSLDPANPVVVTFTIDHLLLSGRPEMALRVAKSVRDKIPEAYLYWNGYIRFVSAGDVGTYRKVVDPWIANPDAVSVNAQVLRAEHRYSEIVNSLGRDPPTILAWAGTEAQIFDSIGQRPVAEYLGWAYLLLNDRPHAEEQGHAVLAFAAKQLPTKRNGFFLRLLEAEAYTFTGQKSEAIEAARTALQFMPRTRNAVAWIGVASLSARVYAWNGAGDEAEKLLEELTSTTPGLQPGLVAREPLFTVPLADHAQFRSLLAKLEEQMRNVQL